MGKSTDVEGSCSTRKTMLGNQKQRLGPRLIGMRKTCWLRSTGKLLSPPPLQNRACNVNRTRLLSQTVLVTDAGYRPVRKLSFWRFSHSLATVAALRPWQSSRCFRISTPTCSAFFHLTVPTSAYLEHYLKRLLLGESSQSCHTVDAFSVS